MTDAWSPAQYERFKDERSRPFFDLLTRVGATDPGYVVDLGCGPGNLTAALAERWPGADVVGLDNSPEMIGAAQAEAGPRLSFAVADLREWRPPRPVDVLVSNAVLQWVPDHLDVVRCWPDLLSPVFESASPSAGPPLGPGRFAELVRAARLPVYALGGVTAETAPRLMDTGASGIAAVEGVLEAYPTR